MADFCVPAWSGEHTYGIKRFWPEAVGEMRISYQILVLPVERGQTVVVYSADSGSPSEEKLRILASWPAEPSSSPGGAVHRS